jgi:hypothetical protein
VVDAPGEEAYFSEGRAVKVTCHNEEGARELNIPEASRLDVFWLGPFSEHYVLRMVAHDESGELLPQVEHQLRRGCASKPLSTAEPLWGPDGFFMFPSSRSGKPGWAVWYQDRELGFVPGVARPEFGPEIQSR